MAIKVSHLKKNTRPLTIEFAGEKVNFTYGPGEITPALGVEMADEDTKTPLVMAPNRALASWDVLDDETMLPVAITEDVLMSFPSAFLNPLLRETMADSLVGKRPVRPPALADNGRADGGMPGVCTLPLITAGSCVHGLDAASATR